MLDLIKLQVEIDSRKDMESKSKIILENIIDRNLDLRQTSIKQFLNKNIKVIKFIQFKSKKESIIELYDKVNTYYCIKNFENIKTNDILTGVNEEYKKQNFINNNYIPNQHILFSDCEILKIDDINVFNEHFSRYSLNEIRNNKIERL